MKVLIPKNMKISTLRKKIRKECPGRKIISIKKQKESFSNLGLKGVIIRFGKGKC